MDATSFFLIQTIAIGLYLTLAVYVLLSRSTSRINFPFIVLSFIQAFIAYSFFLLHGQSGTSEVVPPILRIRWAITAFLPALYLHMFHPLLRGKNKRLILRFTYLAYGLGLIFAIGFLLNEILIEAIVFRGTQGVQILDPQFNPSGIMLYATWLILSIVGASLVLNHAARDDTNPRNQADAKRLIAPWSLLVIATLLGSLAAALPRDSIQNISLHLSMADRICTILAGLLLARGVLGFGSPAGKPIHHRLVPAILPLVAVWIIDWLLVYSSGYLHSHLLPIRLTLISLSGALILANPELPLRIAAWLGVTPPDETNFAIRLNRAWESLVDGSYNIAQVAEMILALQDQISADYAGVLELVRIDEKQKLTFGRWEDGPRMILNSEPLDWPLTEENLHEIDIEISNIPGPPSLILPVHDDQNLAGVLLIGEPVRGGIFSTSDLRLAELLASQLSFALGHGLRLEEALGMPERVELDTVILPKVTVAIRTFGRLDLYTQLGDPSGPRPSLRARQILAILLSAYPDPVPAEALMERLWPEHSQEAAANSLYVAIYALRRSLEPELQKGAVSKYVRRESDCYKLIIDDDLWVDFLEFMKLYWQGRDHIANGNSRGATQIYEKAIRICRRPFLADSTLDLPAEVEVTRHRLQRYMHEMVWHITQQSIQEENWPRAERALLHLLSVDHHDQTARQELAIIYRKQGKEGLAQELEGKREDTE